MYRPMTYDDWDNWHQEWWSSFTKEAPKSTPKAEPIKGKDHDAYPYLYERGNGTTKARFFVTEDGIAGDYGFWVPKSAIVDVEEKHILVAKWCKIKIIEYVRY